MEGRRRLQGLPSRGEGMKDFLKQVARSTQQRGGHEGLLEAGYRVYPAEGRA